MNAAATELSELRELVVTLKAALELSRRENALLRQKIDLLVKHVFGSSSEQLDRNQLELLAHQPESVPVPVIASPKDKPRVEHPRKERFARKSSRSRRSDRA